MSELSEDKKDNFETKYRTGERVTAKVLKVLFLSVKNGCKYSPLLHPLRFLNFSLTC